MFLNHLYGGMDEPEVKIIDVFICKLRKKLARAGAGKLITTIWGRGYMVRDTGMDDALDGAPDPRRLGRTPSVGRPVAVPIHTGIDIMQLPEFSDPSSLKIA